MPGNTTIMKNLKEQVAKLLDEQDFHYKANEEKNRFAFGISTGNVDMDVNLLYDEEDLCLYNFCSQTSTLSEDGVVAAIYKINEIHNQSFSLAHLYIDENDNTLSAQAVMEVPKNGLEKDVFETFLYSTIQLLDDNAKDIIAIASRHNNTINNDETKIE